MHRFLLFLQKTMFMRDRWVSNAPFTPNKTNISECTSHIYLSREMEMKNDLSGWLNRKKRPAWRACKSMEDVVEHRAPFFNTIVLLGLIYASEIWVYRKQEENAVSVIERSISIRKATSNLLEEDLVSNFSTRHNCECSATQRRGGLTLLSYLRSYLPLINPFRRPISAHNPDSTPNHSSQFRLENSSRLWEQTDCMLESR
ncbi:hypothetical protein RB195_025045 [Necator americanus]